MTTSRTVAFCAWIIASIFYAYQYILRVMPSIMLGDIMLQFNIDPAIFGQFSGVYYIGYSLMHLPIGIMLDRFGPRKVMSLCTLLTVVGLLPIIFAENWLYPLLGRALIGMGSSAAILGTFKIIRMTFSEQKFSRMLSISVTIGLIGAIYGGGPVSNMCSALGYKAVVEIFAVAGIILAAITYLFVPEVKIAKTQSILADIKTVLTNKKVIMLCCFAGFMVGPLEGFADVWGAEFLKRVYSFDATAASYLSSMIFVGMCFGAPALSLVAEKSGNYLGTITGAGILMCTVFVALIAGLMTATSISISFVLVGVCCAYQILAIYKASTYVPEHVAGLTTAVANMIIMVFGYAFHSAIGYVITSFAADDRVQAFKFGITVIPITLTIGVVGFAILALRETQVLKPELDLA